MPITFRSEAQASVEMIESNARELLTLLGCNPDDKRGALAPEQLAPALTTLKALIAERTEIRRRHALAEIDEKAGERFEVDISLRAIPLATLLEKAIRTGKPVTWGE